MKHKTLEQVDKERAKFRLACDYYSQLILIGEEDGESWIYWDTKSLNETETLLKSALSYIKAQKGEKIMAQFISLRTQSRGGEIMVNVDEISSCHIEGGFSYTDYILVLKNGTRYNLNAESYNKVTNLISE